RPISAAAVRAIDPEPAFAARVDAGGPRAAVRPRDVQASSAALGFDPHAGGRERIEAIRGAQRSSMRASTICESEYPRPIPCKRPGHDFGNPAPNRPGGAAMGRYKHSDIRADEEPVPILWVNDQAMDRNIGQRARA